MSKRVVLVTGTPCVGKTSVACLVAAKLDAAYVNLTELATRGKLILGEDKERHSMIVDEGRMRRRIGRMIEKSTKEYIIVDGHYAVNVVPSKLVSRVFVLRRDPVELQGLMEQSGFSGRKLSENLAAEILGVCLVDALKAVGERRVCELDATGKSVEETAEEVMFLLKNPEKCRVGVVDWLGKLESQGLLDKYLKT